MGGLNPQDMMKRGILGQVPGAVTRTAKKSPLGQLQKHTSDLIESEKDKQAKKQVEGIGLTPVEEDIEFTKQDIKPLGDVGVPPVEEELEFTEEEVKWQPKGEDDDALFAYPLDETITDKEFLMGKIQESGYPFPNYTSKGYLSVDDPLQDLQAAYRSVMINQYKKLLQESNQTEYINEAKWKKLDLVDLQDQLEMKTEIVKFGKPIALTHYGTVSEEKLKDKMYLAQQLKHLDPFLGPWDEEAKKTWAAEQSNVPLSNLQGYLKEELIKKLKDYFEGTTYLSESPFWASKPLNEIVETYNKMVADKKAGGTLKKATTGGPLTERKYLMDQIIKFNPDMWKGSYLETGKGVSLAQLQEEYKKVLKHMGIDNLVRQELLYKSTNQFS